MKKSIFILAAALSIMAWGCSGNAKDAPDVHQVPGSTSPDKRYAIYFSVDKLSSDDFGKCVFYIKNLLSDKFVSKIGDTSGTNDSDSSLLDALIAGSILPLKTHDPAFGYDIQWDPSSTLVAVEGGEHKFWHCDVYQKNRDGFAKITFDPEPVDQLNALTKSPSSEITDMGIEHHPGDPMVHLLDANHIATDTHPATCSLHYVNSGGGFHIKPGHHLNFLFHIDAKGAAQFVGFCQ
jgi:hypothetical protein